MLASSSRQALRRAQHKIRHAVAEVNAVACVHEQRRYASAAQLAVDLSAYPSPSIIVANNGMRQSEGKFRGPTNTPLAKYNMRMASHLDHGRSHAVLSLAKRMKDEGLAPDTTTYNLILSACAKEGLYVEARAVFEDMVALGVQPNRQTFHHMMRTLALVEQHPLQELLKTMEEWSIPPNEITYEIIITRLAQADRLELALQFLAKMAPAGMAPTLNTASAIVTRAAALGFPRLALDLAIAFEETSVRRLDGEVWVDVLISCAEALYPEGVTRTWQKVVHDLHFLPDEGCCLQVLHTAARHGLSELAVDVISVLKNINIVWCEYHIAPVIEALCRHGELKEAIIMLDFMRTNDITPALETAGPILELISKDTEAVDSAWGQLEMLHEEGSPVDVVALNVVIQAAVALQDLQRAIGTYKACAKLGVTPNLDTFNLLLLGCVDARHRELGDRLLADLKAAGIRPDETTYERMVRLCLTQSMYEDAFFYLEEMKSLGMVPPRLVYEAVIRKLVAVGDVRYKLAVEELQECGYELSPRLKSFIDSGGSHDAQASRSVQAEVLL
ncbi:Pentatricopeptide repeat-containing protein, mitochondrial [Trametes pubescens]|uniref:Pentatricopeptide repeat-containing protein, mitochondrial n=1 Tax=Trametes pubescens TaxID=154538 RepID=A0A1M2VRP5_TRAPU|nr:Pentatricopeptide repeat-containing protein, mitochondrial [Trametes pubescens]